MNPLKFAHDASVYQQEILTGQILMILRNGVSSSLGNVLVATVFTIFYGHYISETQNVGILIWLVIMFVLSGIRLWDSQRLLNLYDPTALEFEEETNAHANEPMRFQPNKEDLDPLISQANRHYIWILLTGCMWGLASLLFFTEQTIAQTVLIVTIAGIAAGSLSSLSSNKTLFMTFSALIFLPLGFQLFFSYGEQSLAFAILLLFYATFMIKSGLHHNAMIHSTLVANLHNQALVDELMTAKQKAENAVTLKSNFLANISHELRTPLNAILGFLSILRQKETDSQKIYYQEVIDESGHHLLKIINDMLDLSKIENHQIQSRQESCELLTELDNILHQFHKQAEQKQIQIKIEKLSPIPPNLELDIQHWKQILANLLSNAIKFSHEKSEIQIHLEYIARKQSLITQVIDQGIGISKEHKLKIFDSFTQGDSSSTRRYGGLGLGLTICQHLTELLGGEFTLESDVGKGTIATFDVKAMAISNPIASSKPAIIDSKELHGHILIVEDNLTNQLLMKSLISKLGLTYDIANDGIEAVEQYETSEYDAILMDENMPRLSGTGATQRIRQIEAQTFKKRIPIIAVTANASENDRQRFLEADMDDFIAKPINIPKLIQTLNHYLNDNNLQKNSL